MKDKLKCANLTSRATLDSLFVLDLILNDNKPNPRYIDIELLKNCSPDIINGHASPRMSYIYLASTQNVLDRELTKEEEKIRVVADVEIEFERVRREVAFGAPSRLSALYLADNDDDGRMTLGNMFRGVFNAPKILTVKILNQLELIRADHRWFEEYFREPKIEYIVNYWTEKQYDVKSTSWEYLLEGSVLMVNKDEYEEIKNHTFTTWPDLAISKQ